MSRINGKARLALVAALGALIVGGGAVTVSMAQARTQPPRAEQERTGDESADSERAPYRSSIQVPDDDTGEENEADDETTEGAEGKESAEAKEGAEGSESGDRAEAQESAKLQSLARITVDVARAAALARVPGTVTKAELENEDGNLVYGVTVKTAAGERDVKVDAGNGQVLHVGQDGDDE